mmetsp:Transcript_24266/g.81631  ORF Transcript_24266/g.81631 Transcript_24266/m.81631 type:complete len:432 (-) Transcript_24266:9-1304(-)
MARARLGEPLGAARAKGVAELETHHEARPTHVLYGPGDPLRDGPEALGELRPALQDVVKNPLIPEDIESGDRGRAGDGVGRVGAAHAPGRGVLGDRRGGGDGGEREARGDPLGHAEDVWLHAALLVGKHAPRAAVARLHLVHDEQDAVVVAPCPEALQEARRRRRVAALPEHGLHDDGARVCRGGLLLQYEVQLVQRALRGEARLLGLVREGRDEDPRGVGRGPGAVGRLGPREAHREVRSPVVASLECNHVGAARGLAREAQGVLHGLGARGGIHHLVVGRRQHAVQEARGQVYERRGPADGDRAVDELGALALRGGDDARVAVAEVGDADAAREVHVHAAVLRRHVGALARDHLDGRDGRTRALHEVLLGKSVTVHVLLGRGQGVRGEEAGTGGEAVEGRGGRGGAEAREGAGREGGERRWRRHGGEPG